MSDDDTPLTPEELARAIGIAKMVERRAQETLAPLVQSFKLFGWRPEFCVIALNAVIHEAERLRAIEETKL